MLLWTGVSLLVVGLVATGTAIAMYRHYNGQVTRVHGVISSPGPSESPVRRADGSTAAAAAAAENFLIVGSDSRQGANRRLPHTGGESCHCADTIVVAHVPEGHAKAVLVSIPRDSWVRVPAYTTPTGARIEPRETKVNAALAIGGPGLLVRTVEALTGLHIHHYVQVDFAGFVDTVNAIDGVDVCLTAPAQDWHTGIDLAAGRHHLNGAGALAYVRQRHGLPNGDLDRIKRQQAVMRQIIDKVMRAGILLHPVQLTRFLDVVTKSVTVDDQLSLGDMRRLASTFRGLDTGNVRFLTVPVADESGVREGQSVVLLDEPKLDALFDRIATGSATDGDKKPGGRDADRGATPSPSRNTGGGGVPCLP